MNRGTIQLIAHVGTGHQRRTNALPLPADVVIRMTDENGIESERRVTVMADGSYVLRGDVTVRDGTRR